MKSTRYLRLEEEALREQGMGTYGAALNYVKSTVGIGIFALPFAVMNSGMWMGVIGFAAIALLAWYTVTLLIAVRVRHGCEDYASVGRQAMGTYGVVLANFAVVMTQVGSHIVHALFIASSMTDLVPRIPRFAWILILAPLLCMLGLIRDTRNLRATSFFGVLLLVAAISTVLGYGFSHLPPPLVVQTQINHAPVDFFVFFGTSIYVFEGINMAIPIHREMRNPDSFRLMFAFVSLGLFVAFAAFSISGYIFFLDAVQQIVVENLPGAWRIAVTALVIVELILSFPVVFFPIAWVVERNIAPQYLGPPESLVFKSRIGWRVNFTRIILIYIILLSAVLIPRVSLAVALAGAFANSLSGIILPTLFYLIVFWDTASRVNKAINIFILIVGLFAMSVTSTFVIARIANIVAGNSL